MIFTALDFETANRSRTSVCAVGISVFEDGLEREHFYTLVRPEPCQFEWFCTNVHGIRDYDVQNSPTFAELYPLIRGKLCGNIVCHNAPFDAGCLRALCDEFMLEKPEAKVHCTLALARRFLPLDRHKLDIVAAHFGLGNFKHHNALDDARICAEIFSRLIAMRGEDEIFKYSKIL